MWRRRTIIAVTVMMALGFVTLSGCGGSSDTVLEESTLDSGQSDYQAEFTPLEYAAMNNDTAEIARLVAEGTNVNERSSGGYTALMSAAINGNTEAVNKLLELGADPSATDESGTTALHKAANEGWTDAAAILVSEGAPLEARDSMGNTPLSLAAARADQFLVRYLLEKGADPKTVNDTGWTPLHFAAVGEDSSEDALRTEVARLLIGGGVEVNATTQEGYTALRIAIGNKMDQMQILLRDNGARQ